MKTNVLRSELIKLTTLPSTYLVIGLAVTTGLGIGFLEMASTAHHWTTMAASDKAAFDPVADSFSGFQFAELAFGALGVLTVTAEAATGTMRPTLLATPHRLRAYAWKVAAITAVALPICMVSTFAAFFFGQYAVSSQRLDVSLSDPHVLRAVLSAGLFLLVVTVVGFGLGAIIRHTAGALTAMVALVFLAWPIARAVEGFSYQPDRWLLVNAADALVSIHATSGPNALRTPSVSVAVLELVTYVAVLLGVGAWRATRDA